MVPNLLSPVFDGRHEFELNSPGLTITLGYNMPVAKNVLSHTNPYNKGSGGVTVCIKCGP